MSPSDSTLRMRVEDTVSPSTMTSGTTTVRTDMLDDRGPVRRARLFTGSSMFHLYQIDRVTGSEFYSYTNDEWEFKEHFWSSVGHQHLSQDRRRLMGRWAQLPASARGAMIATERTWTRPEEGTDLVARLDELFDAVEQAL